MKLFWSFLIVFVWFGSMACEKRSETTVIKEVPVVREVPVKEAPGVEVKVNEGGGSVEIRGKVEDNK